MDPGNPGRSKKVVGLFLAAALTLTPGCSMNPFDWGTGGRPCTDANQDGYCDEDGRPVSGANRYYRSGYWFPWGSYGGAGSSPGTASTPGAPSGSNSSGISAGSKGGIGTSARSGGGSGGGSSGG